MNKYWTQILVYRLERTRLINFESFRELRDYLKACLRNNQFLKTTMQLFEALKEPSDLTALEHHALRQAGEHPPMPIRVYEYKRERIYSKLKDSPNEQEKEKYLKAAILLICSRFGVALQELVNFYLEKDFGVKFIVG